MTTLAVVNQVLRRIDIDWRAQSGYGGAIESEWRDIEGVEPRGAGHDHRITTSRRLAACEINGRNRQGTDRYVDVVVTGQGIDVQCRHSVVLSGRAAVDRDGQR